MVALQIQLPHGAANQDTYYVCIEGTVVLWRGMHLPGGAAVRTCELLSREEGISSLLPGSGL